MTDMRHMDHVERVALEDVAELRRKEATYRGSWKASGGRSAWFMLRRKIDRLLVMMAKPADPVGLSLPDLDDAVEQAASGEVTLDASIVKYLRDCYVSENIFAKIREDASGADGTALAEIRDLRRYLMLVEAEMIARGAVLPPTPSLDAGHAERTGSVSRARREAAADRAVRLVDEIDEARARDNAALVRDQHGVCAPGSPADGGQHARQQTRDIFGEPGFYDAMAAKKSRDAARTAEEEAHFQAVTRAHPAHSWRAQRRRVEDGLVAGDAEDAWWPMIQIPGSCFLNADRSAMSREECEHLRQLHVEQNAKEWSELPAEYQGMYDWRESDLKYVLGAEYREHWGMQP